MNMKTLTNNTSKYGDYSQQIQCGLHALSNLGSERGHIETTRTQLYHDSGMFTTKDWMVWADTMC
jgi:hypothetical protein